MLAYSKIVYKSRGLSAIFQLFGANSIQERFYSKAAYAMFWVCKIRISGLAHVKMKEKLDMRLLENYFKFKQTFGIQVEDLVQHRRHKTAFFCGFCSSAAYVQLEFGESATSIRVRLLIKCGFYTRLRYFKRIIYFHDSLEPETF